MIGQTKYYNVADYSKGRTCNGTGPRLPPQANLLAAVNHIRDLFDRKKFLYGMAGGFEMLCLGHRREMPDVHMVYDDKDYIRIQKKLEADKRILLPDGMNPLFPFKILVRTGPAYQDCGCHEVADIEVNMIPPGSCGSPPTGMLASSLVLVSLKRDGQLKTYKGLDMHYLIQTMLHLATARDIAWDPRKDILSLCQNYGDEVEAIRATLDPKLIQRNFLGTAFFSRLSRVDQRNSYQVLLGKEAPPVMSITPPEPPCGHARSVSDSAIPKTRPSAYQLTPNISKQATSELLSPPLQSVGKFPRKDSLISGLAPNQSTATTKVTRPEILSSKRHARSRHRSASANDIKMKNPEDTPRLRSIPQPTNTQYLHSGKVAIDGVSFVMQQNKSETSRTPLPMQTRSVVHAVGSGGDSTTQRYHTAEAERNLDPLHLAGSEGIGSSQKAEQPLTHATTDPEGSGSSMSKVYELDATQETLAELSGAIEAALKFNDHSLPEMQHSHEELFIGNAKEEEQGSRPGIPRVQSAPEYTIPASLMAGHRTTQHFHSDVWKSTNIAEPSSVQPEAVKTNASRYSRYYFQPTATMSSNNASPQLTPPTSNTYRAYQPPVLLLPPPDNLSTGKDRPSASFVTLKDIDGAHHYFQTHHRSRSYYPQTSHTSQDSTKLAEAYQADLPKFDDGYGTSV